MAASANAPGAKGVGEAGTIGVLSPLNVADLDFLLTAGRLWRTINRSTRKPSA